MTGSGSSVAYNDSRSGSDPVSITFHVMYTPAETKEWNIWAWRYKTTEQYNTGDKWPGTSTLENDSETGYYKITLSNIKTSDDLGIIFVGKTGSPQTKDLILPKEKLIDELGLKYDDDDLGVTINGSEATYKVWAPTASKVELLLYSDVADIGTFKAETVNKKFIGGTDEVELKGTPSDTVEMNNDPSTGIWSLTREIGSDKYYKYTITFGDEVRYVCDINAKD